MSEALIVQGGGRDPKAEEVVAGVRTVLRIQLSDEQRERIGISANRDLALCVNRLCDALTAAEEQRDSLLNVVRDWIAWLDRADNRECIASIEQSARAAIAKASRS